jgi:predicted nucleic acid-binding protein
MTKHYLDTCIWLNIFKKEKQFYKTSKELIENIKNNNEKIIVSTIVIKEIHHKTKINFKKILIFFKSQNHIELIKTTEDDYELARKLETTNNYKLSFYDYLHTAIAKRTNTILITRDKDLLNFAKQIINCKNPNELIN